MTNGSSRPSRRWTAGASFAAPQFRHTGVGASGIVSAVPALSSLTDAPRSTPLVEREPELAAIDRAIVAVAGGSGRAIVFDAPPGLGKSALLDAAEQRACAAGWLVRRAAHGPRERYFAHGIVRTLLETPLRRLDGGARARILAGVGGPAARLLLDGDPPGEAPGVLGHSVVWLCAALAADRPLALLVDDTQWADAQSLAVLSYLARRIADVPVLLVVAARSRVGDWEPDAVGMLGGVGDGIVLQPGAISRRGAGALVRRQAPGASDAECAACHRSSGGNPWLLIELSRQLALSGPEVLRDPLRHAVALSPDARVQLRRRLSDLSPRTAPSPTRSRSSARPPTITRSPRSSGPAPATSPSRAAGSPPTGSAPRPRGGWRTRCWRRRCARSWARSSASGCTARPRACCSRTAPRRS